MRLRTQNTSSFGTWNGRTWSTAALWLAAEMFGICKEEHILDALGRTVGLKTHACIHLSMDWMIFSEILMQKIILQTYLQICTYFDKNGNNLLVLRVVPVADASSCVWLRPAVNTFQTATSGLEAAWHDGAWFSHLVVSIRMWFHHVSPVSTGFTLVGIGA